MEHQKVEFVFLSQPEMIEAGVLDMPRCVDVMDEAFQLMGQGDYLMGGPCRNHHGIKLHFPKEALGPKMPVDGPDRRFMAMISYLGGDFHLCGAKWYGSNAENVKQGLPRSILLVILNDPETGAPLAIMEGNLISAMRTGASVGLGARYLAPKNGRMAGVIAAGPISRTCLMALAAGMPSLEEVKVFDLNQEKAKTFCKEMSTELNMRVYPVDSLQEAIKDADAVSTAASGSTPPKFEADWFKPGAFFALSSPSSLNENLWRNSRLVADNWQMHVAWRKEITTHDPQDNVPIHGELHTLIRQGLLQDEDVVEMGDVVTGKTPARVDEKQNIVYITGGLGIEDVSWGYTVYQRALELGLGTTLKLWDTPHWF